MKKRIGALTLALILLINTNVYATSIGIDITKTITQLSQSELYIVMKQITVGMFNHDYKNLYPVSQYFSSQVMEDLSNYITSYNNLSGVPYQFCVDYTVPDYSSTGDIVIMTNVKASNEDGTNSVYLIEFHVNSSNQIYGYQIWGY